ncbi:hypothetical protein [Marinivivus vitaminiproducens]|uniref:hypothetical protein n=1 Tax=Marinivivus vitaminiproducens TaxID=3035935 RepID=UPI0027A7971F|nr:hypothetical protein P4R82_02300 [Geminicoccaceae bacterium SCSIO 64248]
MDARRLPGSITDHGASRNMRWNNAVLDLQAVAESDSAQPGNRQAAVIWVAVSGPRGREVHLRQDNFRIEPCGLRPTGLRLSVTRVEHRGKGLYRLRVAPCDIGSCWRRGDFLAPLAVDAGEASGDVAVWLRIE